MRRTGVDQALAREITRLSRQHNGAITGAQLRAAGLTREAIRARVARGRLVRRFRDVYIVGDPQLLPLAEPSAALLSLGPTSFLSHRQSLALRGLADPDPQALDVTVVAKNPRARAGIRIHRVKHLHPADTTSHEGLRTTTVARAMIEFAGIATELELIDALGHARARRLLNDKALNAALQRFPANDRGAKAYRTLLAEGGGYDRSRAERLMRRHLRAAGLPQPEANNKLLRFTTDFLWRDLRLIVEVDGRGTHLTPEAFEQDRLRDQVHAAAGYLVVRITWRQLRQQPMAVIARLAQAMAHRAAAQPDRD